MGFWGQGREGREAQNILEEVEVAGVLIAIAEGEQEDTQRADGENEDT